MNFVSAVFTFLLVWVDILTLVIYVFIVQPERARGPGAKNPQESGFQIDYRMEGGAEGTSAFLDVKARNVAFLVNGKVVKYASSAIRSRQTFRTLVQGLSASELQIPWPMSTIHWLKSSPQILTKRTDGLRV